jgi:hypothetical protein
MVLVTRFLWHKRPKDDTDKPSDLSTELDRRRSFSKFFSIDTPWNRALVSKQNKGERVPSLAGIVKAGDEGVYSSTLFNGLHDQQHDGEPSLLALYHGFADYLRGRNAADRSTYSPLISDFISRQKRGLQRSQSTRPTKQTRPELPPRHRTSVDLAEMGLGRARSRRVTPALTLTSAFNPLPEEGLGTSEMGAAWMDDLQHAQYYEGKISIAVTPEELWAMSAILGTQPIISSQEIKPEVPRSTTRTGALGISINVMSTANGKFQVTLRQQKRKTSQLPAKGSGYSTLFAKHLAAGSLPFTQNKKHVDSILITSDTFSAVQSGACLRVRKSDGLTNASRYLSSLPNSRKTEFHTLSPSTTSTSTPLLLHAIANMPFSGGLSPLASAPLISTVSFVASGGLPAGRLLQRLESLVEKVHRQAPFLGLFGPLYEDANARLLIREQERLGKLATSAIADENAMDKAARMHRYTTLLERLMYLVPDMKPQDVLAAVREALKKEIERSYADAVAAFAAGRTSSDTASRTPTKRTTSNSPPVRQSKRYSLQLTHPKIAQPPASASTAPRRANTFPQALLPDPQPRKSSSTSSPRRSSTFPVDNLGREVERVLKLELPFSVETVALVARLILAAWTLSVQPVAWEEGEQGVRMLDLESLPERMILS